MLCIVKKAHCCAFLVEGIVLSPGTWKGVELINEDLLAVWASFLTVLKLFFLLCKTTVATSLASL